MQGGSTPLDRGLVYSLLVQLPAVLIYSRNFSKLEYIWD